MGSNDNIVWHTIDEREKIICNEMVTRNEGDQLKVCGEVSPKYFDMNMTDSYRYVKIFRAIR